MYKLILLCVFILLTTKVYAEQRSASCTITSSFVLDRFGKAIPYLEEALVGQIRSIVYDESRASIVPNLTGEPENYRLINEFDLIDNDEWRYVVVQRYRTQSLHLDNPECKQGRRDRTLTQYDMSQNNVLRLRAICPCDAIGNVFQPAIP